MDLPEKLALLKEKIEETDRRISLIEKEIKQAVNVIGNLGEKEVKLEKLEKKVDEEASANKNRINAVEDMIEKKFSSFLKDIDVFEKWFKETSEKQKSEFESIKKMVSEVDKKYAGAQKGDTKEFSKMTEYISELTKALEELTNDASERKKEIEEIHETISELKDTDNDVHEAIAKLKATDEKLKYADEKLIKTDKRLSETEKKLATIDSVQKSFGELKMDIATTESETKQQISEILDRLEIIQDEMEEYPKIKELAARDADLLEKITELEDRMGPDFEAVLNEFQKLKDVFSRKKEMEGVIDEVDILKNTIESNQEAMDSINEAVVKLKMELSKRQTVDPALDEIKKELQILKQQIIVTQDAIVELNSALQQG